MNKGLMFLTGIGLGAAVMYFFDPNGGGRRRALVRDKAVGVSHDVSEAVRRTTTDLGNRAQGLMHEAKGFFGAAGDETENRKPMLGDEEMNRPRRIGNEGINRPAIG
jgi:hypothetical protein